MVRRKRLAKEKEDDDPVVSEHSIFLLPIRKRPCTNVSINRVQFQQNRYWLRSMKQFSEQESLASFKQNVKQLRFGFLSDTINEKKENTDKNVPAGQLNFDECDVFSGEGFSQHSFLNYGLGFAKNDKIFLLPVDQTYDMHWKLSNKARQTEVEALAPETNEILASDLNKSIFPFSTSPVRIRFAKSETDSQKRRREQSALFKQKLIDQDPWILLKIQKKDLSIMYEKEISKCEKLSYKRPALKWKMRNH